ncbi:CDGSH iron-sulfur domain-containing protein [Sneathiella chinensis]|uniref:Iron-binding zinc finger CDGSH type domain-containing protein n=1 Tax=Sneathiella chinensis TaxID=349750 RepID=A0ABQ5U9D9_9PROT|nr:CDGSH iron-sulfur domain-containing protein [Sneathiella chinensis]GLQ07121.1 hypothetical protein GCM10007924_23420 [Sneathiella chinensis]
MTEPKAEPKIADVKPMKVRVEAGKRYLWCSCGRSSTQPFCDGSHKGTGLRPVRFTPEQDDEVYLCMCKQTGNRPYCDGTHQQVAKQD